MGVNTGFHLIEILPQPLVLKPDPCIAIRVCFGFANQRLHHAQLVQNIRQRLALGIGVGLECGG